MGIKTALTMVSPSTVSPAKRITDSTSRRSFIGGSDARIIMGEDEAVVAEALARNRGW
jgi:hypothetical protein